jgi:5'-3' exonuclease
MKRIALIDGDSIAYSSAYTLSIQQMQYSVDEAMKKIIVSTDADGYELYIEEWRRKKSNFRKDFFPEYKENRSVNKKPPLLKQAREYLFSRWSARVVDNIESEDMVIIRAHEVKGKYKPVICGIDKDLLQYPFQFYNYNYDSFITLTQSEADLNLWRQVCTGDKSCDNIPGIQGIGPAKASKAVPCADTAMIDAVKLYIKSGHGWNYFIQQYNLIKLRNKYTTEMLIPISEGEYEEVKRGSAL